jgi:pilus assembly protein CpaE
MKQLSVMIMGTDEEQRTILQMLVNATNVAKTTPSVASFTAGTTELTLRRIQETAIDVVILDIPKQSPGPALHAIEVLRAEAPQAILIAVGDTSQPQVIVSAMRAGAREFLERPTSSANLLEAFARLTAAQRKTEFPEQRGKVFTFVNAKGGSGATTLAVNSAITMQRAFGGVVLVDLALLGHAALHLNVKPNFTIVDAFRNLHRLDHALLQSYLTRCPTALQLLAGAAQPITDDIVDSNFAGLFDLLVNHFQFVVVDASSRMDRAMRLVCDLSDAVLIVAQSDLPSLWSAAKIHDYLNETVDSSRLRLVLNRYRKIPGFSESDIESTTHMKVIAKIPNHYPAVAAGIERGLPVAQQSHSEMSRALMDLVERLPNQPPETKSRSLSLSGVK